MNETSSAHSKGTSLCCWNSATVVVVFPCRVDCPHQAALPLFVFQAAISPVCFSMLKEPFSLKENGCGHYLMLGDGHDRCLMFLGIKDAEEDTVTLAYTYTLKWSLFIEWCFSHSEDPWRCPIRVVLSFLQQGLERRLSHSTLKVYVAAISANVDPVEGKTVGKHDLVIRFPRGRDG